MATPFLLGSLLVLACALLPLYSAQESCSNRCGESYYRGHICHCDYDCLIHNECCKDYESMCTTSDSCKGRCGESFKRGRPCSCDPDCILYNQCCPDYQMHCGTAPQTSKLINEADLTVAPTQRSRGKKEDINQDLSDNYLIPLSTSPSPTVPREEIQGDESIEQTPYPVPVPTFEVVGPTTTLYPESVSGQEPLPINATENTLSPDGAFTPVNTAGVPTLGSEQEAIEEEISTLFPEDPLLSQSSTGTAPVTRTDVSTSAPASQLPVQTGVPNSSSPAPEQQSDSTNQSPITVSESANPSATPATEHDTISPESSKPTTRIPQEPQGTSTTPEAGAAATPGTAVATKSSDQLVGTNNPTSSPTDSVPSTSQDETPAVAPASSPSPEADGVKGAGGSSSTPPSGAPDRSMSVTPPTGTVAQTDPPSSASATGADTTPAGGNITNSQTGGSKPADEVQNMETQPTPTGAPTTASMRASPFPLQPSKRPTRPSTLTDSTQALATGSPNDYLPEDNNDTNLCSGRPISGVTALHNGTVVVFRGHYFWVLDANRSPGPARGITETWGIPSPIDTVFTRCQCEGKTYFIKGKNYWRFGNDVMDQGYPKPISAGFDKLAGKVTAALSVPATRKRRESVYFFKTGGLVQKYTYKPSSACSRRVPNRVYLVKTRFARQADDGLGKEINIKLKWRGFPTIVTSAVSIPSPRQPDGYDYYIFSRTKYYKIKLDEEKPTLATPLTVPSQQNSANSWFNCP
ncbi:proteoglycan 4b isoform X1 [Anguilla rostrata]